MFMWFMRTQICIMTWVLQGKGDLWGHFQCPHNPKGKRHNSKGLKQLDFFRRTQTMTTPHIFWTLWWGQSSLSGSSVLWLHGTPQKSGKSACLLHSRQHIAVVWSGKRLCSFWSKWGLYQAPLSSLTANCVLAKAWEQDLGGSHMSVSVSWPWTQTVPMPLPSLCHAFKSLPSNLLLEKHLLLYK